MSDMSRMRALLRDHAGRGWAVVALIECAALIILLVLTIGTPLPHMLGYAALVLGWGMVSMLAGYRAVGAGASLRPYSRVDLGVGAFCMAVMMGVAARSMAVGDYLPGFVLVCGVPVAAIALLGPPQRYRATGQEQIMLTRMELFGAIQGITGVGVLLWAARGWLGGSGLMTLSDWAVFGALVLLSVGVATFWRRPAR